MIGQSCTIVIYVLMQIGRTHFDLRVEDMAGELESNLIIALKETDNHSATKH